MTTYFRSPCLRFKRKIKENYFFCGQLIIIQTLFQTRKGRSLKKRHLCCVKYKLNFHTQDSCITLYCEMNTFDYMWPCKLSTLQLKKTFITLTTLAQRLENTLQIHNQIQRLAPVLLHFCLIFVCCVYLQHAPVAVILKMAVERQRLSY